MRLDLPSGTVTFLFTDVEGSTRLLHELGAERYADALAEHRRILRATFAAHDGVEVDTQGDAFFVAFPTAPGALAAAAALTEGLTRGPIRVRVGLHTGTPFVTEEGYVGEDVHRAARIAASGHGGQVLVSASTATLVDAAGLRDLGEHRLKDLSAPERIHQLGEGEFPPLKSLYRTNLPIPATPFLGRETELGEVCDLLTRADVRLLTLTGPGGTGKTRLALQSAGALADRYPDGVYWVPLAPLRDPQLVLQGAAQAVGADDGLAEHIADKRLLLLLDNFEHVTEAATDAAALLTACPNLHLLVTSRELLRLPAEQAYPVPPLAPEDGSELFLARARAAEPGFTASASVPELCARLEQLPLALELAAARVRVLSPEQLLERLSGRLDVLKGGRGVDARQQTLRATIEWSHDLLDAEGQKLFARLAVFRGGCTLGAAEQIADADVDTLQSLVDKSLLRRREHNRFWMLETIREYAAEQLDASDEGDRLARRHAEHFLALAEEAEPRLERESELWIGRLEADHDNLRAALDRLEATGDSQRALRLAGSLARFWESGYLTEGQDRLERLLSLDASPTAGRARALVGAATMARQKGDPATTRLRADEAQTLYVELDDSWGAANAGILLGLADADEGDFSGARGRFEDGARLYLEAGDEDNALFARRLLGWMHEELGDIGRSRALHEENLTRARELGNRFIESQSLGALAYQAAEEGRTPDAVSMLEGVLRIDRDEGSNLQSTLDLTRFARVLALAGGRPEDATRLLSCADARREDIGVSTPPPYVSTLRDEAVTAIRQELDADSFTEAWELGRMLTLDEAFALALGEAEPDA